MITVELRHNLSVNDADKKQTKKTGWKIERQKQNVTKLRDER